MKNALMIVFAGALLMSFHLAMSDHLPIPIHSIAHLQNDSLKIALGKQLFYDPILSRDSSISCSSCHSQYNAFAHSDHALSHGINDRIGTRNASSLINLAWSKSFMWDGANFSLEAQVLTPLTSHHEMDNTIEEILRRLNDNKEYTLLFARAFGTTNIATTHLVQAMAAFESILISKNSRYDSMKMQLTQFTEQESKGYEVFKHHCNSCHTEPLFTNGTFADNGLSIDTTLNDLGRYRITLDSADLRHFKIPTLRNVQYSFPFMHDGRFKRLREVIHHYSSSIDMNDKHRDIPEPLHLSDNQITELLAFLYTLTDRTFLFNPSFSLHKAN